MDIYLDSPAIQAATRQRLAAEADAGRTQVIPVEVDDQPLVLLGRRPSWWRRLLAWLHGQLADWEP